MSTQVFTINGRPFVFSDCITCGVLYCVPESMWGQQSKKGGYHYCSNGHRQGWGQGETEYDKLRRERDIAKQQLARAEQETADANKRAELAQKQKRRMEKRAAAGTCPCCQRTFSNMSTHMRKQHPEFVAENVVPFKKASK